MSAERNLNLKTVAANHKAVPDKIRPVGEFVLTDDQHEMLQRRWPRRFI